MFLSDERDGRVVYTSASDLTVASKCEFAFLRGLDARLNRIEAAPPKPDPMLERAGRLSGERVAELGAAIEGQARRTHLCARLRGSLRLIPLEEVHFLQAEEKYTVVHHARGEDLIEESLKSLEEEFGEQFLRIHRNCLVARDELQELRRDADGRVHAALRNNDAVLEVSRRCLPTLRQRVRML